MEFETLMYSITSIYHRSCEQQTGFSLTWKTWNARGNLLTWKTPGILC